ncbi:MAG: hypothetical protein JNG84_06875, partial [Archangium sp.]|nr:hypothetical protein [Archangium sp.]
VTPSGVDVPGRLSLGGALALGGGRRLNITSPLGWVPRDEKLPNGPKTAAMTKWLLTAQLDVFFPVQGATLVGAFLQQPDFDAKPAGYQLSFQPRFGVEKELFIDLLRLRTGTYLEPPLVETGPFVRPHWTVGFELFLFKLGKERVSFGLSLDFANRYMNMSFGFLVWK